VLVTRADKPYKSVKDVVAAAKAKPASLTIGNAGSGGAHHLSAKTFEQAAGIEMIDVPYKGGGPAAAALLAGEIDMMFEQTYAALPSVNAGKTARARGDERETTAELAGRADHGGAWLPASDRLQLAWTHRAQGHAA
jgi:tripartite-type tricarboxylate transporter receptor subunit TctC